MTAPTDSSEAPSDPPLDPMPGTTRWFESGPDVILRDVALATLIARVGMAGNGLAAQVNATADAHRREPMAVRMRDVMCALVTSAALTNEAVKLGREGQEKLHPLAQMAGVTKEKLDEIDALFADQHPAAKTLVRARNKLGFHWDRTVIKRSVEAFSTNERIVWLETGNPFDMVHRFAFEVQGHALMPAISEGRQDDAQASIDEALKEVSDAMNLIGHYFTGAVIGYMVSAGITVKTA